MQAMEPMAIFARTIDAPGVARLLCKFHPGVVLDGPEDSWRSATVSFGSGKLTFTHDPEYYAEPHWSTQMNGMRGYYARFPDSEQKESAMMLTTTFKFSLGLLIDLDASNQADPRLDLVFAIAKFLDGVVFTPSYLFDANRRVLIGADGEIDPEAVWPRVRAEVKIDRSRHSDDSEKLPDTNEDAASAPSAERVARRALALTALGARALLEQKGVVIRRPSTTSWNPRNWLAEPEKQRREILVWIELVGIGEELEPGEWEVLQRPIGRLERQRQVDSTWRLEGLVVLSWALGRCQMPSHDKLVSPDRLLASLDIFNVPAAKELLALPALRPRPELGTLRARLLALHWRLKEFRIRPKAIDFNDFARNAWFGPLDITGLPLIERDLAVAGKRIDRADLEAIQRASSAAHERHLAVSWLWQGPQQYSRARTDT